MNKIHKTILVGVGLILFSISCFEATPYLPQNGVSVLVGEISAIYGLILIITSAFEKESDKKDEP